MMFGSTNLHEFKPEIFDEEKLYPLDKISENVRLYLLQLSLWRFETEKVVCIVQSIYGWQACPVPGCLK